jgi:hypothetical protein
MMTTMITAIARITNGKDRISTHIGHDPPGDFTVDIPLGAGSVPPRLKVRYRRNHQRRSINGRPKTIHSMRSPPFEIRVQEHGGEDHRQQNKYV